MWAWLGRLTAGRGVVMRPDVEKEAFERARCQRDGDVEAMCAAQQVGRRRRSPTVWATAPLRPSSPTVEHTTVGRCPLSAGVRPRWSLSGCVLVPAILTAHGPSVSGNSLPDVSEVLWSPPFDSSSMSRFYGYE